MKFAAQRLAHAYDERVLFKDLTIEFPENQIIGIIGPNGSGKSTLLRLLAGIENAQQGYVVLGEKKLLDQKQKSRAKQLSYLPQKTTINYDIKTIDIVLLGRTPFQNIIAKPSSLDYEIAYDSLESVGMRNFSHRAIKTLSGGEFQRVMLARLLATQADNILLDEAITALDIGQALAFLDLCEKIKNQNRRILIVIHQLDLAYRYCDSVLMLGVDGNQYFFGSTQEVMTRKNIVNAFGVDSKVLDGEIIFFR